MSKHWLLVAAVSLLVGVAGCDAPTARPGPSRSAAGNAGAGAVGTGAGVGTVGTGARFVPAPPEGDVAELVRRAQDEATRGHRALLVYVGATWCEPCQYFHRAVEARRLDQDFPGLTLLEFDLDRDARRLAPAGYVSRMIPLFAVPGPDGRTSGRHMEGSIHGPDSVQEIVPRLRALLGG